jgi:hypothetical protein
MSFSILTVTPPLTASQQVYNSFLATTNNTALEGQYLRMCFLDTASGVLANRQVQSALGQVRTPSDNVTQIALTTNTATLVSLTGSTLDSNSLNFDMPTNARLRYIGTDPTRLHISCKVNYYSTVNNQQIILQIYRNGVAVPSAKQTVFASNGLITAQSASVDAIFTANTNDYFELYVTNATNNNPIIIYNMSLTGFTNFS